MDDLTATDTQLVPALTHIAAVYWRGGAWRVVATYLRGTVPAKRPDSFWMFVPASVNVGDEILSGPGTTTYADPVWAERYAAEDAAGV
jgi:hypothetical protein